LASSKGVLPSCTALSRRGDATSRSREEGRGREGWAQTKERRGTEGEGEVAA
jgi:hypothetical protein